MPSASEIVVGTTDGSASSFAGTVAPVGDGMTPGTLYLSIDNGLGGFNGIGTGQADDGAGNINLPDGDGFGGAFFASTDGVSSSFQAALPLGFVIPGSINVYVDSTLVASDDGAGNLVGTGSGSHTTSFPGNSAHHTYHVTLGSTPVVPGSVTCGTVGAGGVGIWADDGAGNLVGSGITAGTINYSTGACDWTDANDHTSVNLQIDWTAGTGVSGTVNYTPGNATVVFSSVPSSGETITVDASGYGAIGTIGYAGGAYSFQTGNASPIVGSSGFNLYFSYQYAAFTNPAILASVPQPAPVTSPLQQQLSELYGVDILCLYDLDPNFALTPNALPQDCFHRITEASGSLFWTPNGTQSIYDLIGAGLTAVDLSNYQGLLESVLQSDDRVQQAQVSLEFDGLETIQGTIVVVPVAAPAFQLVIAVSQVTIQLLQLSLVGPS